MLDLASPSIASFDQWSRRIHDLIGDFDLDEAARSTGALVRRRSVKSAQALLHLALARGPGGFSLRQTAAWAHMAGVADLTDASLNDRLHQSCDFLGAVVAALLRARTGEAPARQPGRRLRIADGTCVSKPGGKRGVSGTDWRIHAVYDLGAGGFSHLEITDAHGGEAIDRGAPMAGEIRSADRGYANAKALRRFIDAGRRTADLPAADFVVRLRWNACKFVDPQGQSFDLINHLPACRPIVRSTKFPSKSSAPARPCQCVSSFAARLPNTSRPRSNGCVGRRTRTREISIREVWSPPNS